ncbi:MAG TPA: class I SAM-dependent methyltransferase [Acidimicrobiales bacterium]|nr:class I SAM-dependent methyltransferase [Acidimicrobiales bacterium]
MTFDDVRRRAYYRMFGGDRALAGLLRPGMQVLDVGCSDGRGSVELTGAFGCDVHRPTLQAARDNGRRTNVAQTDVRSLPYRDGAFDVVVALDVIEHFDKDDAHRVLREMERVTRDIVVIVTPSGFVPQPPTETEPWQEHRCGFEAAELRALGFDVRGLGGWSGLRREYGAFRGGPVGQLAAVLSEPFVRADPDRGFHLLAVKHLRAH